MARTRSQWSDWAKARRIKPWIAKVPIRRLRGINRRRRPLSGEWFRFRFRFRVRVVRASERARRSCVGVCGGSVSQRWASEWWDVLLPWPSRPGRGFVFLRFCCVWIVFCFLHTDRCYLWFVFVLLCFWCYVHCFSIVFHRMAIIRCYMCVCFLCSFLFLILCASVSRLASQTGHQLLLYVCFVCFSCVFWCCVHGFFDWFCRQATSCCSVFFFVFDAMCMICLIGFAHTLPFVQISTYNRNIWSQQIISTAVLSR